MEEKKKRVILIIKELKKIFPNPKTALDYSNEWEFLVAVILSAQCTDAQVNKTTSKLFKRYKTINDYANADITEFQKYIYSTGFYKNKTKNILAAAKLINNKYKGKIPKTMGELLRIPGVARKTANVVLGNKYGIAVDTHVKRLAKLFGLTDKTDPVKVENDLLEVVPKEEWANFTFLMIEFGRKYCPARDHNHEKCLLLLKLI